MESKEGTSATRAKNKYNAKAYDRLHVSVKKGQKEEIEKVAASQGLSTNAFIVQAIDKAMEEAQK